MRGRATSHKVYLHTDPNLILHRLINKPGSNNTEDIRVMPLLAYLREIFSFGAVLEIEFLPSDLNVTTDLLSCWYVHKYNSSHALEIQPDSLSVAQL